MATRGIPLSAFLIARIASLTAQGWGVLRISKDLKLSRMTVRKYRPRRAARLPLAA